VAIYLGFSYLFYKNGLFEKSVDYCTKALSLNPEPLFRELVLVNRSRSLLEKGDLAGAYKDSEETLGLNKKNFEAHNNLGLIYYRRGLYEKAKSEYELVIDIHPDLSKAYNNLGLVYVREGQIERAIKLFETSYGIDKNSTAKHNLDMLKSRGGQDWWNWWFGPGAFIGKKIIGSSLILLLLFEMVQSNRMFLAGKDIPISFLGIIGVTILLLVFPWIRKLEIGPLKLECESKGERLPTGWASYIRQYQ